MKKITPEEHKALVTRPLGKKHAVRAAIEKLQSGEILQIDRNEFRWKGRTPSFFCNQISKATGHSFRIEKLASNTGWVVIREK